MATQKYVIRHEDRLWEVWLGQRLLSGQPTQRGAINLAEAPAHAAAARGERPTILMGTFDGVAVELPMIEAPDRVGNDPA